VDEERHRQIATKTFSRCWDLLERRDRTRDDDAELLATAFASRYHWTHAGEEEQRIVGDWMISRAAADVGEAHLALTYAQRAYDAAQDTEVKDWLLASVAEGLTRAYAANGDVASREQWRTTTEELIAQIKDNEDRDLIAEQVASIPT